ncbi:TrkH family potassium uptake protein [Chelativorans sp. M5D2P16]|uniref:TrkH family potassium uptake protein n=1 Tax=Chelativorans sp. M5D2P16 TaxID=3095678 RepID=UPI002ACA4FC1|nr:TrkH family potassium uptake protein [Chelativorans sp. M5D2P16]MDZ5697771.1 TrkH family potassium uptake protein [Chelativorans sp. M5D2P16]
MHGSVIRAAAFVAAIFALYIAGAMLLPALVDLYYGNKDWKVFAVCAFTTGAVALTVAAATRDRTPIRSTRLAFFVVAVLWTTLGVIGGLPLYTASLRLDFTGAVFESVSAITTTGSTVISGLDDLPPGILLWRSLLQWIGGLGVIALGLFFLPLLNVGGFSYFRIESSDIEDRPFDRLASFLRALVGIYIGLTALCAFAYVAAGMSTFDAVNHAMTTLATGGFSTHDASFGYFEGSAVLLVGTLFMILGALPFSILILFIVRGRLDALRDPQIRLFLVYTVVILLVVAIHRRIVNETPFSEALVTSAFNIVSIITTTGYASEDYSLWGPFSVMVFFFATFLGGCSGSTSGGTKAYRFVILARMLQNGLRLLVYGRAIQPLRYGTRVVDEEMQRSVTLFVIAFIVVWVGGSLALAAGNVDIVTSMTASLTALTNVGPGLGPIVGPAGNFTPLSDYAKWILCAIMLLGRLEILAVLVLFTPTFWRN